MLSNMGIKHNIFHRFKYYSFCCQLMLIKGNSVTQKNYLNFLLLLSSPHFTCNVLLLKIDSQSDTCNLFWTGLVPPYHGHSDVFMRRY